MTGQWTVKEAAMPDPARAPISAWDEDEGSPNHHVMRFHAIAPRRDPKTMTRPRVPESGDMSTIPPPMVLATSVPSSAPRKFMIAAMTRAILGDSARVATDVAMAFAAS